MLEEFGLMCNGKGNNMIRRSFLKLIAASPLLGLVKGKQSEALEPMNPCPHGMAETTSTSDEGYFWIQTYGTADEPCSCGCGMPEHLQATAGTSNDTTWVRLEFKDKSLERNKECQQWLNEVERKLNSEEVWEEVKNRIVYGNMKK